MQFYIVYSTVKCSFVHGTVQLGVVLYSSLYSEVHFFSVQYSEVQFCIVYSTVKCSFVNCTAYGKVKLGTVLYTVLYIEF